MYIIFPILEPCASLLSQPFWSLKDATGMVISVYHHPLPVEEVKWNRGANRQLLGLHL